MIIVGDVLKRIWDLEPESVQCFITSPPYWGLRDYGVDGQIGLEERPDCGGWVTGERCGVCFVCHIVEVCRGVHRAMRKDGTLWLNLGDGYAGSRSGPDTNSTLQGGRANQNEAKAAKLAMRKVASRRRDNAPIPRSDVRVPNLKPKDMVGGPWRVALALQADGWYLRQDIIWDKKNPMPESVTDRCTKAHEYLFLLTRSQRYYFNADAIREPITSTDPRVRRASSQVAGAMRSNDLETLGLTRGKTNQPCSNPLGRNKRSVWSIPTESYPGAHFATFPRALVRPCMLAGSRLGDLVWDPFMGSGTVGVVAEELGRRWGGNELNPQYAADALARIAGQHPGLPLAVGE